jgi:hypothetical protein
MVTFRKSIATRLTYAIQLLFFSIVAWILSNLPYWVKNNALLSLIPVLNTCPQDICYGTMAVYRITFSLTIYHVLMAIMLVGAKSSKDGRSIIQDGLWGLKFLILVALMVATFFIPNFVFIPFVWISLFGAGIFILIQLILLVDFAHTWSEIWVAKYEQTQSRFWAFMLLASTFAMYAFSIALIVVMYVYYIQGEGCSINTMFITLGLILCFVVSVFSINPYLQEKNPRAGILPSSVVTAYCTYLVWSALMSEPPEMKCSPFAGNSNPNSNFAIFVGVFVTFLAVVYSALRVGQSSVMGQKRKLSDEEKGEIKYQKEEEAAIKKEKKESTENPSINETTKLINTPMSTNSDNDRDKEEEEEEEEDPKDDEKKKNKYNYSFFHLTFAMASMYLGLVLTNWEMVSGGTQNNVVVDQSMFSVWVKIISSWLTIVIYAWTLIAPVVLPDREW